MNSISYKPLTSKDKVTSRTLLHESIPITGTLLSGTYATASTGREVNIKTFSHGMFQSVYDYPYLSSSANHIFDITAGFSANAASLSSSALIAGTTTNQLSKKVNIYNQMAQILVGFDTDGKVRRFDADGDHTTTTDKIEDAIFLNFSRLLTKDEIKKGSFSMIVGEDPVFTTPMDDLITITDSAAATNYRANSPAGEYGFLKSGSTTVGLLYYQAGIAMLTSSVFSPDAQIMNNSTSSAADVLCSASIDNFADGARNRIQNISFNNTTELNSSIYFCRAGNGEFNYSSNPTYLSGSKIRVKTDPGSNELAAHPISYVTTVGLYSPDNELLAVAKLSEPLKKTPFNELILRVRLDY